MKKKILAAFIPLFVLFCVVNSVFAIEESDIHSNEALLVNMNTDEILFSKNTNDKAVPIASLTKIMTFLITTEEIDDVENTTIKVPEGTRQRIIELDASNAGLIDGYEYKAIDLLYGLMLPSGCDCADVLAQYIGDGNKAIFVEKMNQKANELEMTDTIYVDESGLGDGTNYNVSTEQDLYKLVKYAWKNDLFRKVVSTEYYRITGTNEDESFTDSVRNTNYLMGEYKGGEYYNPYSIGGKTGTLSVAGRCLVTVAQKGDLQVVAITLGVPGETGSDYNLVDHQKLFDFVFNERTENITIDIGPEYRSVEAGKKLKIEYTTSEETEVTWTSSDEEVAKVNEEGIVEGISQGQAKITATTSTGNIAYTYVSVDMYNGVHTKYSTGPANEEGGWDPIDYSIIKEKGFDYVIIRAGYGTQTEDKTFIKNIQNALDNDLNVGIWYEGYSKSVEDAQLEAENLIKILDKIPDLVCKIKLPIFYNLLYSDATDSDVYQESAKTFARIMNEKGYRVILELGKTRLSTMDLEDLKDANIDLSIIYRATPPDYKTVMSANGTDASVWNYKDNHYMRDSRLGNNASLSLMYMSYMKLQTIHKEYIEKLNPIKPIIDDDDENEEVEDEQTEVIEISESVLGVKKKKKVKISNNNGNVKLSYLGNDYFITQNEEEEKEDENKKEKEKEKINVSTNEETEKEEKTNLKEKDKKQENKVVTSIIIFLVLAGSIAGGCYVVFKENKEEK